MSTQIATMPGRAGHPGRNLGRSIGAVAAALLANVVLSLATDQLFHALAVYPPWGEPMPEPSLNLLALAYRTVFGVVAGYVAARLAPRAPMRHVAVLGAIALVMATAGAVVAITRYDLGPDWYPIALALLAFPTVWLGGAVHRRRAA
jgi:hypothetical protein